MSTGAHRQKVNEELTSGYIYWYWAAIRQRQALGALGNASNCRRVRVRAQPESPPLGGHRRWLPASCEVHIRLETIIAVGAEFSPLLCIVNIPSMPPCSCTFAMKQLPVSYSNVPNSWLCHLDTLRYHVPNERRNGAEWHGPRKVWVQRKFI